MLYRALLPLARAAVWVFHRKIVVRFADRVPASAPVILAANHPNMMLDVLLVAVSQRRRLHFLAKSTMFENRLLGALLRAAGVLPVYRRKERPDQMGANERTFEACHELLANGGAIAIFPEGVSHEKNVVLPLKTGCARIALEAESKRGFDLGLRIVPAGIAFSDRALFRSDAVVVFGEPIAPAPFFADYRAGRTREAVLGLTAKLEAELAKLAPHLPDAPDEALVRILREFFRGEGSLAETLEVDRELVEAVRDFRERHPLDYARLRRSLLSYGRALSLSGLTHEELGRRYRFLAVARYLAPRLLLAVAGAVPFLAGAVTHYLPYKIPAWIASKAASHPVERATAKLFTGLVTFPLFYGLEALFVARVLDPRAALAFLLALPALGLFALFYLETLSGFWRDVRVFLLRLGAKGRLGRLQAWRRELEEELSRRREAYERRQALEKIAPE